MLRSWSQYITNLVWLSSGIFVWRGPFGGALLTGPDDVSARPTSAGGLMRGLAPGRWRGGWAAPHLSNQILTQASGRRGRMSAIALDVWPEAMRCDGQDRAGELGWVETRFGHLGGGVGRQTPDRSETGILRRSAPTMAGRPPVERRRTERGVRRMLHPADFRGTKKLLKVAPINAPLGIAPRDECGASRRASSIHASVSAIPVAP